MGAQRNKWKMLWDLMAGQRLRYFGAMGAMLLATLSMYVVPLISGTVIDYVIQGKPLRAPAALVEVIARLGGRSVLARNLWLGGIGIVVFTAISGGFSYIKDRWLAKASERIICNLRDRLYAHLQELPCGYHDKVQTGDLVQRCTSDVETVKGFLGTQAVEVTRAVLMLVGVLPFMIQLSPTLTLVAMSLVPVVVLFSAIFFSKVKYAFRLTDEAEGAMTNVVQENLTGIRVVRAFARQQHECDKFARSNATYRQTTVKLLRLLAYYWSASDFTCHLQNVLLMGVGAYWIIIGKINVGTLFAFIAYEGMLLWPVRQMGRVLTDVGKAQVSMGRLQEILQQPTEHEVRQGAPAPEASPSDAAVQGDGCLQGAIEVSGLGFAFGDSMVLDGVSFAVRPGQTLAILGPSGSGKSVLVHLLLRMYDYTSGSIRLDGRELRGLDRRLVRSQIGVVLQEPFLYSKSLKENIGIGTAALNEEDMVQAAVAAGIHDSILDFEKGYDTLVGERGVTLSGGQRQRVALARAILKDPPILILDDALSAVDTRTEGLILAALRRRHGKRTTLLISHRLSALRQADWVLVFHHGRLLQQGTHESLLGEEGLYSGLWRIQTSLEEDLQADLGNGKAVGLAAKMQDLRGEALT